MKFAYDVFLSHNSRDKAFVERIAEKIANEAGLNPFLDKWNLIPGDPWQKELEKALDSSKTVAVFLGSQGISPWQNEEMQVALQRHANDPNRRVIPVLLSNTEETEVIEVPSFLSNRTWVKFTNGVDDKDAFDSLISGILGRPKTLTLREPLQSNEYRETPKVQRYLEALYDFIDSQCKISFQTYLELPSSDTPQAVTPEFKFDYIASAIHKVKQKSHNSSTSSTTEKRLFSTFTKAFEYYQGRVLLLGAPGSGKTTTLLNFARQAIQNRLADPRKPIPIWANISTWDLSISFKEWIEEQTHGVIPKDYPRLYLLDGLDEIIQESDKTTQGARSLFIQQFNENIKREQVVISCRTTDYFHIAPKIDLAGAITLKELSNSQIQEYLLESGFSNLFERISTDKDILSLVRTPLMLSLMMIAYKNRSDNSYIDLKAFSEWHIFDRFVKTRILHESKKFNSSCSEEDIRKYLGKLAIKRDGIGNITFRNYFSKEDSINVMVGGKSFLELSHQMQFLSKTYSGTYKFSHLKLRDYFAIDPLIEIIRSDLQKGKGFAAYAFETIGTMATNVLVNLLASDNNSVRERALWALGAIRDDRAIPPIIELLSDDDAFIRWYAIEALSLIGNSSVIDDLIDMFYDDDPDPNVRGALVLALGKFGSEEAIPVLREALYDEEIRVSDAAAAALEEIGSDEAMSILEEWVLGRNDR